MNSRAWLVAGACVLVILASCQSSKTGRSRAPARSESVPTSSNPTHITTVGRAPQRGTRRLELRARLDEGTGPCASPRAHPKASDTGVSMTSLGGFACYILGPAITPVSGEYLSAARVERYDAGWLTVLTLTPSTMAAIDAQYGQLQAPGRTAVVIDGTNVTLAQDVRHPAAAEITAYAGDEKTARRVLQAALGSPPAHAP